MDNRTRGQRWADAVTEFSGSWPFIWWFAAFCVLWVFANLSGLVAFDVYPFLFLNWTLTIVSTFQSPLILMSQNRQNDHDREAMEKLVHQLDEIKSIVEELRASLHRDGQPPAHGLEPLQGPPPERTGLPENLTSLREGRP
jgi:uncharacterized membrane protein